MTVYAVAQLTIHDRERFPDRDTFLAWANSPEYVEITKDRHAGADTVTVLVRGLRQP